MLATRRLRRMLVGAGLGVLAVVAIAAAIAVELAHVNLERDSWGLARLDRGPLAGSVQRAHVETADGRRVAVVRNGSVLTPATRLAGGQQVEVDVRVERPNWLGWALGSTHDERLALTTPRAIPRARWITAGRHDRVRIRFTGPVWRVSYVLDHQASVRTFPTGRSRLALGRTTAAGSVRVAATPRPWLLRGPSTTVTWFPRAHGAVAIASPGPGRLRGPADPIRLTFSRPVRRVLGSRRPTLSPSLPGRWRTVDDHSIEFVPAGYGAGLGTTVHLRLPRVLAVAGPNGSRVTRTDTIAWRSQPGSTLRLQQLLAQAGYLPVRWTPAGAPVAETRAAQSRAAESAPKGTFSWRYPNTPPELRRQWTPGRPNTITRGALMMFQDEHGLTVDGIAGPKLWTALLDATIAHKRRSAGYSYVYVHRRTPQHLVLWHNGHTVLTSPGNTGVPAAPTQLGTFPVFEHVPVTTMSGTNPDGSHYHDPGIKWVSYFNGGDALHAFNRASFGTPQSLGCVELPEATARRVWPYTPIGTLVTIEP